MSTNQCRDINKLNPKAKLACEYLLKACKEKGLNIIVTETLRTTERQQYLYAQGRTRPGNTVTNCDGVKKKSIHQFGNAFDVCQNIKGKEYDEKILNQVGKLGEQIGLEWGGSWKSFKDSPHFQLNDGVTPKDITAKAPTSTTTSSKKYTIKKTKLRLNGVLKDVDTIELDGFNHIKLRDLSDNKIFIEYKNKKIYINGKEFTGKTINQDNTNYVKLRDLPQSDFKVDFVNKVPTLDLK